MFVSETDVATAVHCNAGCSDCMQQVVQSNKPVHVWAALSQQSAAAAAAPLQSLVAASSEMPPCHHLAPGQCQHNRSVFPASPATSPVHSVSATLTSSSQMTTETAIYTATQHYHSCSIQQSIFNYSVCMLGDQSTESKECSLADLVNSLKPAALMHHIQKALDWLVAINWFLSELHTTIQTSHCINHPCWWLAPCTTSKCSWTKWPRWARMQSMQATHVYVVEWAHVGCMDYKVH